MEHKYIQLTPEIKTALDRERNRLGTVSPQFSYYERVAAEAQYDDNKLHTLHSHVVKTGGFSGL